MELYIGYRNKYFYENEYRNYNSGKNGFNPFTW